MLLDHEAGRRSTEPGSDADDSTLGLDLDDDRTQHGDAPARPRRLVFGVAGHRIGYQSVDQPVALFTIVIVAAGAAAGDKVGTNIDDLVTAHRAAHCRLTKRPPSTRSAAPVT